MRFGLFNLMNQYGISQREVYAGTFDCVRLADDLGFDVAWFAEHHFANYSLSPSPLMVAAAAARETKRIRLGPAVVVAPLYNPIRLTEEVALLDQISNGRAVLGIGSGYQKFEFDAFGMDLGERQDRMLEVWQIISKGLSAQKFAFDGHYYQLPDVCQAIELARPRQIDTYYVAFYDRVIRHAVAQDATPFVTVGWGDSDALAAMRDAVDARYAESGFSLAGQKFAAQRYVYVSDDDAELDRVAAGIRYAGRCAGHMRVGAQQLDGHIIRDLPVEGEPSLAEIRRSLPIGPAEVVAERLVAEIRRNRITDLSCFMMPAGIEPRAVLRSMERFGAEVMPLVLRTLAADGDARRAEVAH